LCQRANRRSFTNPEVKTAMLRRRLLAALIALPLLGLGKARASTAKKTVLFVCEAGTVKSAVSRELFRRRIAARRLQVVTISRGLVPAEHRSPALIARLAADGIDTMREPVLALDQQTLDAADVVVLFAALPPGFTRPDARDWIETPSMNDKYAEARAYLDAHLDALAQELAG
jgi:hypothetical protein